MLKIDKAWLEARLQTPFVRESEMLLPAEPTAADLISAVNGMDWAREGRKPFLVFEKARGHEIKDSGF